MGKSLDEPGRESGGQSAERAPSRRETGERIELPCRDRRMSQAQAQSIG